MQYMTGLAQGGPPADFGAILKALHCMLNQWQLLQVTASSHCMHNLVYSWFGTFAPASPDTVPFGSWRCSRLGFGRGSRLASRLWGWGRLPRGAPGPTGGRSNFGRRGAAWPLDVRRHQELRGRPRRMRSERRTFLPEKQQESSSLRIVASC